MRLHFEHDVAAPPAAVFSWLLEPELHNRWSDARMTLLRPGEAGDAISVGALRQVVVGQGSRKLKLLEVVDQSEPPYRAGYRVIDGAPLAHHQGRIVLEPRGAGTFLRWTVDFGLTRADDDSLRARAVVVPERLMHGFLTRSVGGSLRRMVELAEREALPPRPIPAVEAQRARTFAEPGDAASLRAAAEASLADQHVAAAELAALGDGKQWFARVYTHVTRLQLEACDAGAVSHPLWVLRLIPRFHRYWADNLARWRGQAPGAVEDHWRSAFRAMEAGARDKDALTGLARGLYKGVRAHIEEDLPRALAEVHVDAYASLCDFARFRADYLLMSGIFSEAGWRLLDEIPAKNRTTLMRALMHPWAPRAGLDAFVRRRFYDVARERRLAFERAERLTRML